MEAAEYNPLDHSVVQALLKPDATHRYEVPEYVEALVFHLKRELDTVYWNWNQSSLEDSKDWQLVMPWGFEYRRYCWGDCDCGANSPVHIPDCRMLTEHREWNDRRIKAISDPSAWSLMSEDIRHEKLQEIRDSAQREGRDAQFSMMMMFAQYGSSVVHFDRSDEWEKDNPVPSCSCGAEQDWKPRGYHLATCSPGLPNMKFGDVTINWYKYIGRGMSTNVNWTAPEWVEWFNNALGAISLYNSCNQLRHQKFRAEDAGREPFKEHDKTQCVNCNYCVKFGAGSLIWDRNGSRDIMDDSE